MQQQPETQELRHSWAGRPDEGGEDEIDLVELMYRLLEKWKIIVLACILGALIAGVYTICFVTPMYTATSKLYVVNAKDSAINLSDLQVGNYLASDYTEVFSNWHVHEMVLERLGLDYTYSQLSNMVSVTNPQDTRILYVAVQSSDPQEAKDLADTYAQVAREFIAVKMDTEQPNIFEEALLPSRPSSPNKSKNVLLGFVIGLVLSCGIIVVQFLMDDRLRSADDIEKYVQLPTLGVMPKQEKDAQRTAYLEKYSIHVVRIPNNEVTGNFRGVCEYIDSLVKQRMEAKDSR